MNHAFSNLFHIMLAERMFSIIREFTYDITDDKYSNNINKSTVIMKVNLIIFSDGQLCEQLV